ncbi:REJ domain protein (macronuclear) [Tetrahymena thermophila SB210]|uniref:REJ domain protein n=1 Tax=Tetrahymena thermophila (strain SB210) TaxID=312017 RepID=Q22LS5_TETTS|nr:REJ domain protein [Tetrahymena thermophila SB210]EAR86191.2 REJ domain protein [Tetrahymena thermophila SB210]|eukprot:XP_976786.2 REJ domain protein [Tetrahymena thermophila SB210]
MVLAQVIAYHAIQDYIMIKPHKGVLFVIQPVKLVMDQTQTIVYLVIQEYTIIKILNNVFVIRLVKPVMVRIQIIVYLVILEYTTINQQNNVFVIQHVKLVMAQIQIIVYLVILENTTIKILNNVFVILLVKPVMGLIQIIVYLVIQGLIIIKPQNNALIVIRPVKLAMDQVQVIVYHAFMDYIIINPQNNVFVIQPVKLVMVQIQTIVYHAFLVYITINRRNNVFVIQLVKLVTVLVKMIVYPVIQDYIISKLKSSVQNLVIKINFQMHSCGVNYVIKVVQVVMDRIQTIAQVVTLTAFSIINNVLAFAQMGFKVILLHSHVILANIIGAYNVIPATPVTCYNETRQIDVSSKKCVCKNQNDQRNIFYQCSYQNIAVVDARLSATSPKLIIDLGSPLINIISNTSQSLCSQIFDQATLDIIGLDSQCQISGNHIQVDLSDSSTIMENNSIFFLPNKLQFTDYSDQFINVFYTNITFQDPPGIPQLQFSYNHIENSCNSINITLYSIQNDAGRKFMSLNWTLNQIEGSISNEQQESIKQILLKASQNKNTSLIIGPQYIPPNINITIQFSYLLKINQTGVQTFTIIYQKQKLIRVNYQQSLYPPIYRSMSLSFYFQFYIETCHLGLITHFNEPVDLQLVSNQLQKQSLSQYNQSSFQYDILPYSLASNQTFNMSLILNLSSDNKIATIQNVSVNIQITDLYLQIIGGSSLNLGYQNKMVLNTESRDYEIQDQNSFQNINFSWKCSSFSSNDHICYDYQNKQIQLPQGASSITFPAKTFQPYTIIQLTVVGQKDSRQSNFTTTCIFSELNIPPLNILQTATSINRKFNLNDDLNFQIIYGENISSDYFSYAGAILYDNDAVAAIKFDYFQIRFRIWNYFQKINPSKPTLQIRFSVYNPLFVMPSSSIISIQINIPPQNCVLNINPLQGIALQTIFQIQLLSCTDEDLPLTYQFFYYNSADDAHQELVSPWNILRRQIQDQTTNNSIQTVLPNGNLVVMVQVMDSYLGVYNSSSLVQVQAQNKSVDEYYKLVNELTSQANIQATNQLVTLSIIAEDISKNNQLSQQLIDLVSILIQNIQQQSLQIPKFSLLSTFANKVTAQLSQLLFSSSYQNNVTSQKNTIFTQLQTILQNTNSSIQNSNLSHLQQNNDIQIQNMVDSFKILNSSVTKNSNNSYDEIQSYDQISTQIGNLLNNISLPNQGQITLNGDLSTLLSEKVTQKNLFKYVISINDQNFENQTSLKFYILQE